MTSANQNTVPDREAIRAELEATRTAFHKLVASLSDADWERATPNRAWRVKELVGHVVLVMRLRCRIAVSARQGKSYPPIALPESVINWANDMLTRMYARRLTPQSMISKYDEGHVTFLSLLEQVNDHEWDQTVTVWGLPETVEDVFRCPIWHFEEHAADIRQGLGRE